MQFSFFVKNLTHLAQLSSGMKGIAVFNKKATFAPTCFIWVRSKLHREVVSIMLRMNMF